MDRFCWLVAAVATSLVAAAPCEGGPVRYVDDDAAPGGDGTSWKTAYRFLQDALADAASPGSAVTEIRVAGGIYRPDRDKDHPDGTGNRNATFQLLDGVTIAGTFAGLSGPDPDRRDAGLYPTTLSGDLAGDDGPPGTFTKTADNSYNVVTGSGADRSAILDGFTITAGNADGPDDPDMLQLARGGGMWNATGSPTIRFCSFEWNFARERGAGLYNYAGSSPEVSVCVFTGNVSSGSNSSSGGGMRNFGDSNPVVASCVFNDNSATFGGGMQNAQGSSPTVTDCQFNGNSADSIGGGMANTDESSPTVTGCWFSDNSAETGGGIDNQLHSNPLVEGCTFVANTGNGGGINNGSLTSAVVNGCAFMGNTSPAHGGGMLNGYAAATIVTNCQFLENAANNGGAICNLTASHPLVADCSFLGNAGFALGGAICNTNSGHVVVTNCGIYGNSAGAGGGIANDHSNPLVSSCLITGNSADAGGGMRNANGSAPTITRCQFVENVAGSGGGTFNLPGSSSAVINCRFRDNTATASGGGIFGAQSWMSLFNCELAANTATSGGGIYLVLGGSLTAAGCTIAGNTATAAGGGIWNDTGGSLVNNSILWGNADAGGAGEPAQVIGGATPSLNYCCIQGLTGSLGGIGNIGDDPMFADPITSDNRLLSGSPCFDAGHNWLVPPDTEDLDGDGDADELAPLDLDDNPRFSADQAGADPGCGVPAIVDMGAFEVQGDPAGTMRLGDLNGNGSVGIVDLLFLLIAWGPCAETCCLADLDFFGVVDIRDLLALLSLWTPGT